MNKKKYYIYPGFSLTDYYEIASNQTASFKSPMTNYYLTRNKGAFFGEGDFCGYYSDSGYVNCHVIAKTLIEEEIFKDDEGYVTSVTFTLKVAKCDYISDKSEENRVPDRYCCPTIIFAKDDEDAYNQFVEYIENECKEEV